uniref:Zinc-ribbon domain-containing protein n=1 Tax=Musa acuminata subsp. malaccensis TaxID=214687 RepID=A0A804KW70_MUSAM
MAEEGGEETKVRVVRCPNCSGLLPELANLSVYRCGGCGATLQVKRPVSVSEALPEQSEGVNAKYPEVLENSAEKKWVVLDAKSETDRECNGAESMRQKDVGPERAESSHGISVSETEQTIVSKEADSFQLEDSAKGSNLHEGDKAKQSNSRRVCTDGDRDRRQNGAGAGRDQDQAELLRLIDKLRNQVQRTREVSSKQKLSATVDRMTACANRFPDSSWSLNRNPSCRPATLRDHNGNMLGLNDMPGLGDPLARRRAPFQLGGEYPQRLPDNYLNGHFDPDPIMTYNQEPFYHKPACSCARCFRRQFSVLARGPPTTFGHQRVPCFVNNHKLHPVDAPSIFGSRSYNSRFRNASFHSHEPQAYQRAMFSKNVGRSCQPFAGAAPFMVCCNCFELLELPAKLLFSRKKKFNLRCGACSKVILVQRDGSRLVASGLAPTTSLSSKNNDIGCSPGDCVQSTDEKKKKGPSSSSTMSEHVDISNNIFSQDVPTSSDIPLEPQVISRVPSLPIRKHLGSSLSDQANDASGTGSCSRRSEQDKNTPSSSKFRQNSVKDVTMATEMDVSVNEFPNANSSHDYSDMISEHDVQPRVIKAGDSFLAGLKKSFRFHKAMGSGDSKVSVNGHPIPDRLVKKAEKQAGLIHPGDYWYDYHAGFWGVMGHPCHGIIPPFIEEFNYPMPKNCGRGNTGVIVNGRELHHKDLDLLIGRGLPSAPGSYKIEISGRVWDESSGEELDSLGKLAPTVERNKHGFGMWVP